MKLEYAASTHKGNVRKRNEDSYYIPGEGGPQGLAIVADGMGGYNAGDVASALSVQVTGNIFMAAGLQNPPPAVRDTLRWAFREANRAIAEYAATNEFYQGMGTTMTLVTRQEDQWVLGNVGDSRGYLIRDGVARQVTRDHSLVQLMVDRGRMSAEEAQHHPYRNVITRAVGGDSFADADIFEMEMLPGDVVLLCSDGLSNYLDESDILAALSRESLQAACEAMVALALDRGGSDNITVVLCRAGGRDLSGHGLSRAGGRDLSGHGLSRAGGRDLSGHSPSRAGGDA